MDTPTVTVILMVTATDPPAHMTPATAAALEAAGAAGAADGRLEVPRTRPTAALVQAPEPAARRQGHVG